MWVGYGAARARRAWHVMTSPRLEQRRWRTVRIGHLSLRVPPDWGDVERTPDGGFVIHDRPERYRIDGDAAWYSTAVELRIRRPEMQGLPDIAPMTETCRSIETRDGPVVVALAIANGVGPGKRRRAHRVLASVRAIEGGPWLGRRLAGRLLQAIRST